MLGASIYLSQDLAKTKQYLTDLASLGVKEIFTSMHIAEENTDDTLDKLKEVSAHINQLNMLLMIDVSSATLKLYDMTFDELLTFLKEIKVQKLRLDYGFTDEQIIEISKQFTIVLNASTLDEAQTEKFVEMGLDLENIIACHNFYPRPETGLSEKLFLEQNKYLKDKGFKVQAFIPGDKELRGPISAGLPTLEVHRGKDPLFTYLDLMNNLLVDEVLIGDISISEEVLARIQEYIENDVIVLRTKNVQIDDPRLEDIFWDTHTNRRDVSDYVVRSAKTRLVVDFEVEPIPPKERKLGTITIDNKNYGRYNGEMQITKRDLPEDERVNVLGQVIPEDLRLLEFILGGVNFKFR